MEWVSEALGACWTLRVASSSVGPVHRTTEALRGAGAELPAGPGPLPFESRFQASEVQLSQDLQIFAIGSPH